MVCMLCICIITCSTCCQTDFSIHTVLIKELLSNGQPLPAKDTFLDPFLTFQPSRNNFSIEDKFIVGLKEPFQSGLSHIRNLDGQNAHFPLNSVFSNLKVTTIETILYDKNGIEVCLVSRPFSPPL